MHTCLDDLGDDYKNFNSSMNTKVEIPKFIGLISMLVLEEENLSLKTSSPKKETKLEQAFYSTTKRGRGCGRN